MLRLALFLICLSGPALAGAWPRDKDEVFVSLGGTVAALADAGRRSSYDPTLYLEYGLTPQLTLGIDGHLDTSVNSGGVFFFLRFPVGPQAQGDRWAVSLGTGALRGPDSAVQEVPRLGLHWGRGRDGGWLAVDGDLRYGLGDQRLGAKVDVTWGQRFDAALAGIVVATAGLGPDGTAHAAISPSLLYEVTPALSLRAGLVQPLTGGSRDTGLSAEVWLRF